MAATSAVREINSIDSFQTFWPRIHDVLNAFDTHSAPVSIAYYTLIKLLFPNSEQAIYTVFSASLSVFLFLICRRLFPTWIALIVASIAVFYTPLYALLHSYMPERFGAFFVPIMLVAAVYFALRAHSSLFFAMLTGTFLGLVSLYRIEARWIGFPFVALWMTAYLKDKIYTRKRIVVLSIIIFTSYLLWSGGWMIVSRLVNNNPYYTASSAAGVLYNTYNYPLYGWSFSTSPVHTIPDLIRQIAPQGPISLLWLQLAQIIRLWFRPATAYAGEYLIPDAVLFLINYLIIGLAVLGFRKIFREKRFLFLFIPLFWMSFVSFIPEDMRRQVPLIGLILVFAAAGIDELYKIFADKKFRLLGFLLIFSFFLIILGSGFLLGLLSFIYPQYVSFTPLRVFVWLLFLVLFIKITKMLLAFDKKNKKYIFKKLRHASAFVPIIIFLSLSWYNMRSRIWHEWTMDLHPGNKIEQHINLSSSVLSKINSFQGYLLIDIKDAEAGKNIQVSLNGQTVNDRFTLKEKYSPVDLMVLRQFQRGMPRLGFGRVEDEVASQSAFPNMHEWLITRVSGNSLKRSNVVNVENKGSSYSSPIIYGDYYFGFKTKIYEGPTPRIFQGAASFLKFEVDQDIRLPEQSHLLSLGNDSVLYVNGKKEADLSESLGVQTGRYRIFFLFPFAGEDPVRVF